MLNALTDLGDLAVLGPAAAAVAGILAVLGQGRAAFLVVLSLAIPAGLASVAKLALFTCAGDGLAGDLRSPSGHSAMALSVFGTVGMLAVQSRRRRWQAGMAVAVGALVAAVAVSRVLLGAHTPAEVMCGLVLGGLSLALVPRALARVGDPAPLPCSGRHGPLLAIAAIAAGSVFYGTHLSAEDGLRAVAAALRSEWSVCADRPPAAERSSRITAWSLPGSPPAPARPGPAPAFRG